MTLRLRLRRLRPSTGSRRSNIPKAFAKGSKPYLVTGKPGGYKLVSEGF